MTNEAERETWGGESGAAWVRRQADLDRTMNALTALLLDRARLPPGARVLDLGCGAGDSTLAAARAVGPEGRVTGLDISALLLSLARARAETAGLANIAWAEGDAQTDQAPGGPFDAVISRLGVMFFDDPRAAFANVASQMRPGAPLTFVAWAAAAENPWLALPHAVAIARLGPAPASDPDAPGPTAFRNPSRVLAILAQAGFHDGAAEACDVDLRHPGGAAALADLGLEVGPAAWLLRLHNGTPADREAVRRGLEEAYSSFATVEGIGIPARVLVYSARVA